MVLEVSCWLGESKKLSFAAIVIYSYTPHACAVGVRKVIVCIGVMVMSRTVFMTVLRVHLGIFLEGEVEWEGRGIHFAVERMLTVYREVEHFGFVGGRG